MGDAVVGEAGEKTEEVVRRRRRWPFVVAVLVVLVALGLWGWYGWLPGYRPSLHAGERYGVDVSNHQREIDWARVAGDDIEFAYVKATEGGDFVDERFQRNWGGAAAVGLDRGAYHFFTLCRPGAEQAENFLRTVPSDPDALPPAVDFELAGNCSERPDRAWIERELGAFLEQVENATGHTVVLYVGDDFEGRYHIATSWTGPSGIGACWSVLMSTDGGSGRSRGTRPSTASMEVPTSTSCAATTRTMCQSVGASGLADHKGLGARQRDPDGSVCTPHVPTGSRATRWHTPGVWWHVLEDCACAVSLGEPASSAVTIEPVTTWTWQ
jgi:lysozyme